MTEENLPRETGAEHAERKCPTCGGVMNVEERPTGSLVATCPNCDAHEVETEQAAEQPVPREQGTPTHDAPGEEPTE